MTEAQIREAHGIIAALLQADMSGDDDGFDTVVDSLEEPRMVVALLAGMLTQMGHVAYGGHERFSRAIALWEPGQQLPTPEQLDGGV